MLFRRQFTDPNISVANWVTVVLEYQRLLEIVYLIRRCAPVNSRPLQLNMILNENTVIAQLHLRVGLFLDPALRQEALAPILL